MANFLFKLICTLAGLFGAFILLFALVLYTQGYFASLDSGTAALKISSTIIRAAFLLLCAWAAWRNPYKAAWFAWGALFVYVIGGSADQVFKRGLVGGLGNLMLAYYYTILAHALLAAAAWLLAPKDTAVAVAR